VQFICVRGLGGADRRSFSAVYMYGNRNISSMKVYSWRRIHRRQGNKLFRCFYGLPNMPANPTWAHIFRWSTVQSSRYIFDREINSVLPFFLKDSKMYRLLKCISASHLPLHLWGACSNGTRVDGCPQSRSQPECALLITPYREVLLSNLKRNK